METTAELTQTRQELSECKALLLMLLRENLKATIRINELSRLQTPPLEPEFFADVEMIFSSSCALLRSINAHCDAIAAKSPPQPPTPPTAPTAPPTPQTGRRRMRSPRPNHA